MRILTVPDGGTVNVLDVLQNGTGRHARRTLERAKRPRVVHCIVQQHLVARCILQEPEIMPHEPVPSDISASITAGVGTHARHASQRAGPATLGATARSCRGAPHEPRPPTSAGMGALTVLRSRAASLDKREARVTGRQRAAARDRTAVFCELYLRAGGPAHCAPHDGAFRGQSVTAKIARVRRQRPRRQRRDGCEQKARRHRFLCVHGHVSSLPLFDDSRSRFHKKINL